LLVGALIGVLPGIGFWCFFPHRFTSREQCSGAKNCSFPGTNSDIERPNDCFMMSWVDFGASSMAGRLRSSSDFAFERLAIQILPSLTNNRVQFLQLEPLGIIARHAQLRNRSARRFLILVAWLV
jgi:hypothetical protein